MTRIHALSLEFFTARLRQRAPCAFVRYGDGEFNAILGAAGQNCDGHAYFPDLGTALAKTLREPRGRRSENYLYALGPKAAQGMRECVTAWLRENAPALLWHDTEVFLRSSLTGELYPLVSALNQRRVVFVGAAHLVRLWERNLMRPPQAHVVTPDVNAWLDKNRIAQDILQVVRQTNPNRQLDAVLFSAGMLSKVLIWELYPLLGNEMSLWDTGSLFDMYCGKDSRSYARKLGAARKCELARQNFKVELSRLC